MLAEIAEEQGFSATYDDIAELTEDGNYLCSLADITSAVCSEVQALWFPGHCE